jgi:ABC-type uncharacterized transport system involved in gliding motility auxiliary subunit
MNPQELKENFSSQLEKLEKEIGQLRQALAQRQELAIKLQGAVEAMNLQLGETSETGTEPEAVAEAMAAEPETPVAN